ncbi:MAG: hypothetical protein ACOCV0_03625 [Alkalispirochaeta sp.]
MDGNILVGQSGGPTAVINASLAGVIAAARAAGFGDDVPSDLRDDVSFQSVSPTTATVRFRESSGGYTWHGRNK